jgi:hypothetical protein
MAKLRTHYDNLKVTRHAPDSVIKAAHKALLQQHHPDKAADKVAAERITRILNTARDVLLDPDRRLQHDAWIKEQEQAAPATGETPPPRPTEPPATEQAVGQYLVSSNGTAMDNTAGLMWCRFALGQRWQGDSLHGEVQTYTWRAAQEAADLFNQQGGHAGHTDWRVPSVHELKTLLASRTVDNVQLFPKNPPWLWSSSPFAGYGGGAWFVNFTEGLAVNDNPSLPCAVRLVRNGSI